MGSEVKDRACGRGMKRVLWTHEARPAGRMKHGAVRHMKRTFGAWGAALTARGGWCGACGRGGTSSVRLAMLVCHLPLGKGKAGGWRYRGWFCRNSAVEQMPSRKIAS